MKRISKAQRHSDVPLHQLKISLKGSKPLIWRRVIVPADTSLNRLHRIIQIAMGWTDSHLHQFFTRNGLTLTYYGEPHPDYAIMGTDILDENSYCVADLAPAVKTKFFYEYDFGDGWKHEILIEKIIPSDGRTGHPVCLGGANACPPEDCGGIGGYYDLLEILADPSHEEHESMKDWIGGEWDATKFDPDEVNAIFK